MSYHLNVSYQAPLDTRLDAKIKKAVADAGSTPECDSGAGMGSRDLDFALSGTPSFDLIETIRELDPRIYMVEIGWRDDRVYQALLDHTISVIKKVGV